jgi:class I fructose-bisphosphate aldolase
MEGMQCYRFYNGRFSLFSRKYAHKIPFVVKLNHNELLTYPKKYDQIMFWERERGLMGAIAVGATVYFDLPNQIGK